jgi:hypothetical protein
VVGGAGGGRFEADEFLLQICNIGLVVQGLQLVGNGLEVDAMLG